MPLSKGTLTRALCKWIPKLLSDLNVPVGSLLHETQVAGTKLHNMFTLLFSRPFLLTEKFACPLHTYGKECFVLVYQHLGRECFRDAWIMLLFSSCFSIGGQRIGAWLFGVGLVVGERPTCYVQQPSLPRTALAVRGKEKLSVDPKHVLLSTPCKGLLVQAASHGLDTRTKDCLS